MPSYRGVATLGGLLLVLGVCGAAPAQSASAERCRVLAATFDRYYSKKADGDGSSGARLDRDVGEAQCQRGNFADGIRQIETAMRRSQIAVPDGR